MNVLFVPDDGSPALPVLVGGEPENVDEIRAKEILSEGKFEIKIQLGIGEESAKYWTCDFSYVSLSFLFETFFAGPFSKKLCGENLGHRRIIYLPPSFHPLRFLFSIIRTLCLRRWILNCSAFFFSAVSL